jgi:hypothetical protein
MPLRGTQDRRNTDDEVLGDGGLGLEYRFRPHIGLFSDVRYNLVKIFWPLLCVHLEGQHARG